MRCFVQQLHVSTPPPFERQPMQCVLQAIASLRGLRLPALPVRRSSVRRSSSLRRASRTTPLTCPAVPRRRIASISTAIPCAIHRRTLCAAEIHAVWAPAVALQLVDDAREFVLECVDASCDDLIGIETTDCLDVVEEAGGDCVVVEGFVGVGRATVEVDAILVFGPGIQMLDTIPSW
jgi:hypothetical protein